MTHLPPPLVGEAPTQGLVMPSPQLLLHSAFSKDKPLEMCPTSCQSSLQLSLAHRGPSGNASPRCRCWGRREWVLALLPSQKGVFRIWA